ncbi:MAG: hypothetical protein ACE5KT_04100 [Methanosarcinales archaeon]
MLEKVSLTLKDEKGNLKAKDAILLPEIKLIIKRLEDSVLTTA